MNTPARIAHHTPGRVRIEFPGRRADGTFFADLAERLRGMDTVTKTRANPAAASLVVEYGGPFNSLLRDLERASLQFASPLDRPGSTVAIPEQDRPASELPGRGAAPLRERATPATPMLMAGALFGTVGVVQLLRGEIMIPALSAFWYATAALRLAQTSAPGGGMQTKLILP